MAQKLEDRPLGDVPEAFMELLRAQIKVGQEYFEAVTGTPAPFVGDPLKAWQNAVPTPVCHVPPPCWMPRVLAECASYVGTCDTACVRVVVTNCDRTAHPVRVRVEGDEGVKVTPQSADVGPLQRVTFEVCRKIPDDTERGHSFESLIWIEGCRQHVLRWTVHVDAVGLDSCHEMAIDDCPDYRHHWYDHFYCIRSCDGTQRDPNG